MNYLPTADRYSSWTLKNLSKIREKLIATEHPKNLYIAKIFTLLACDRKLLRVKEFVYKKENI